MDYKQYEEESSRTFKYQTVGYTSWFMDQLHCVVGISTEAGELLDSFKKAMLGKELDSVNVEEELADIMWYVANLCRIANIDFEKILQNNINKLKVRYPEKFDLEKSNNRDLDSERKELEK